jgi:hypothetical protein
MERGVTIRRISLLIAVNVVVPVLLLTLLEGAARLFAPETSDPLFSDPNLRLKDRPFVEEHSIRGFALVPNYDDGRYFVNEQGFRGGGRLSSEGVAFEILALGDSTTFGWLSGGELDYPSRLAELLRSEGYEEVRVVNAGVPSYSSRQVLLYLREILSRYEPDLVIVNLLWNDLWYGTIRNWHPDLLVRQTVPDWQIWLSSCSTCRKWRDFAGNAASALPFSNLPAR